MAINKKKKTLPEESKAVEKKKVEKPTPEKAVKLENPVSLEKLKKDHSGVGLVGKHQAINTFKSGCVLKGESMGETLLRLLKMYNEGLVKLI